MDQTEMHLGLLRPELQNPAHSLIYYARTSGLPLVITSSLRSPVTQAALVKAGLSKTLQSKHIQGLAFDVDLYGWDRNKVPQYVWTWLGRVGKDLGLVWGGSWKSFYDPGHFEY